MKWFYHSATVVTACSSEDNCLCKTISVTARQGSNPSGPALAAPKFPQSGCKGTENLPNCQTISPFFDDFSSRKLQKRCLKGSQKYAEKIKSCFKLSELSFLLLRLSFFWRQQVQLLTTFSLSFFCVFPLFLRDDEWYVKWFSRRKRRNAQKRIKKLF